MTTVLDAAQASDNTQDLSNPLELSQNILLVGETAPLASLPLATVDPYLLVFAPAPTFPTVRADRTVIAVVHSLPADLPVSPDLPAPLVRSRRFFRVDWYETAVVSLILSCATLCLYRLMWAIQP